MKKDSEQLQIDQPRKLIYVAYFINRTKYSQCCIENGPKSEPSDVDKEQNNEVKIIKTKYHPQHWLYLVLLMK